MVSKSVVIEVKEIIFVIELIELGVWLQLLEVEMSLLWDCLIKLYKELKGVLLLKGMLLFLIDWFMMWQLNIYLLLFYNIYWFMQDYGCCELIQLIVKVYWFYLEYVNLFGDEVVLSFMWVWMLVCFFDLGMLQMILCMCCGGYFVVYVYDLY